MHSLDRRSRMPFLFALALLSAPIHADEITTTVTAQSSGTATFMEQVAIALGMDFPSHSGEPAPYEMMMSGTLTPRALNYVVFENRVYDYSSTIRFQIRLGGQEFEYVGPGFSTVQSTPDSYTLQTGFDSGSYTLYVYSRINQDGAFTDNPLTPATAQGDPITGSTLWIDVYPANPDAPNRWTLSGTSSSSSLSVTTPVPEPGQGVMLSAGALLVGVALRRRTAGLFARKFR